MTSISFPEKLVFRCLLPPAFHILFLKPVVPSGHRSLPETWHSSWYLKSNEIHELQTGHPHLHGYNVWYFLALRRWLHSPTNAVTDCFYAIPESNTKYRNPVGFRPILLSFTFNMTGTCQMCFIGWTPHPITQWITIKIESRKSNPALSLCKCLKITRGFVRFWSDFRSGCEGGVRFRNIMYIQKSSAPP